MELHTDINKLYPAVPSGWYLRAIDVLSTTAKKQDRSV
jgi:hypothetical protein